MINEDQLATQWFQDTCWSYIHGPEIAPEGPAPERSDFREVILKGRLASAIPRLADLMRRFGICEEKSSGVDRVVETAELLQLPAPDFIVGFKRTAVVIFGPRSFKQMD